MVERGRTGIFEGEVSDTGSGFTSWSNGDSDVFPRPVTGYEAGGA